MRTRLAALLLVTSAGIGFGQSGAFTPRDESPEEFAPGRGREEAFYACTPCHNFKLVAAQGLSRARCADTVTFRRARQHMRAPADAARTLVLDSPEQASPPRPARKGGWQNPFAPR